MRLIDADELWAGYAGLTRVRDTEWQQGYWDGVDDVVDGLNKMPIVDAVPVVHGRWIDSGENDADGNGIFNCSLCKHREVHNRTVNVPYCWFCGAKMDLEADDA